MNMGKMAGMAVAAMLLLLMAGAANADVFGATGNQFTINFVPISGDTNPASGIATDSGFVFSGVADDYRISTLEITNDQWNKFAASLGVPVTGSASNAYDAAAYWPGANVATNNVSWYEAAQFVNWLNTSTYHQPAYKFTGTQGTNDYTIALWTSAEAENGTNLYRHKDAMYYLPTEDEWVKAGYWNGTTLQTYTTKAGQSLHKGDGVSGTGWDYSYSVPDGPWVAGIGSEELNGTYDMMGSVMEWVESPLDGVTYSTDNNLAKRALRGGGYYDGSWYLSSANRNSNNSQYESFNAGFRVASDLPGALPVGTQISVLNGASSAVWGNSNTDVSVEFDGIDSTINGALDFAAETKTVTGDQLAALENVLDSIPEEGRFVWVTWAFTLSRNLSDSESTNLLFDLGRTDLTADDVRLWHFDGATYTPITSALDFSQLDVGVFTAMGISGFSDYTVTIPEPATLSLLALGGLAMLKRRRNS